MRALWPIRIWILKSRSAGGAGCGGGTAFEIAEKRDDGRADMGDGENATRNILKVDAGATERAGHGG